MLPLTAKQIAAAYHSGVDKSALSIDGVDVTNVIRSLFFLDQTLPLKTPYPELTVNRLGFDWATVGSAFGIGDE